MIKKVLKNQLTSRMQFNLWFLLLGLLAVPFIPVRPVQFSQIFSLLDKWKNAMSAGMEIVAETTVNVGTSGTARQMNDFALSVSSKTPSVIGLTPMLRIKAIISGTYPPKRLIWLTYLHILADMMEEKHSREVLFYMI